MKFFKSSFCLLLAVSSLVWSPRTEANNAGAVVLVNSQSAKYLDYVHFLQPYLGNFGVPYDVLDISSNAVGTNLTNYALIIVGHAQLDTNHAYLNAAGQSNISWAVSNGTGFVSFDNVLATNNAALYQFEQTIFGLGYTNAISSGTVVFPPTGTPSQMHYITSLHLTNETLTLSNANNPTTMTVAGLTLPTNVTAVATCGGAPFVVIAKYGQGRAVQWTSYDWMSTAIQGPVNGLDDLVWRGFTWAARKPFVMRGMPHLATMRIDDVTGDEATGTGAPPAFWWIHAMTNAGFKPWLALFIDDLTYESYNYPADNRIADLSNLVASGLVTASVHSFSANQTNFFYFDHLHETSYSDSVMAANFVRGTQWLQDAGIPSSTVVIAHYSEVGTNAFNGQTNWGVQFFMDEMVPGTVEYAPPYAPWLVAGPYRLYDPPQQGQSGLPLFYADWLTIPNHPELNGKFFDCYTEIRNVGPDGEWPPGDANISVANRISIGYYMMKRGFDSMTLGNIFTHEFYIDQSDGPAYGNVSTNDFATILQGITNELAPYNPIYVTMDYACQYVRATRTSQITSADFNPVTGLITATLTGKTDLPINVYVYTGADSAISNSAGSVPIFTGTTNVTVGSLPGSPATLLVTADAKSRTYETANPVLTYTITGFQGTDTVAVVTGSAGLNTTAVSNSPVGTYPITITNVNLSASNYSFAFTNGTLTVNPATLLVSADAKSRLYESANPPLTYTTSGFLGTDTVAVVTGSAGLNTTAVSNSPVGTYPITITNINLSATNYTFTFASNLLTVSPATLLVSADAKSRLYETANPLLTYTTSGFLGTDTVAVVTGSAGLNTTAVSNSPVGTYPITITNINLSAANYTFTFASNLLTVNPATLLVSADAKNRLYESANPPLTYTASGFLGTDTVAVVTGSAGLSTTAVSNSPVGTYPITITNINLSASNYTFTFASNLLTVNPATLLVSADAKSRLYETANPPLTYTTSGFLGTDTVAVVTGGVGLNTTAVSNSPVGMYSIAITNINLSATNYTFTFASNLLTVTPATLLVSANNQSRPYGATNPALTYTMSGFLGSDTVAVVSGSAGLGTTATTNSPAGTYPITISNINLSATNYNFAFTNGTLTVGQLTLLVSADNQSRTYCVTNPVLTYTMSGFAGTDTVAVVSGYAGLSTAAASNSPVGTYPITISNLNLSATNYGFSFSNGWLTVNPATLLVSADNQSRPYGATNPVLTYSMAGYLGLDNDEVVSGEPALSTGAGSTSPVGTYAITVTNGSLAATNYNFAFSNATLTVTATAPVILSITGAGTSNVVVTWSALSNATYRVHYLDDLTGTNWQSLAPDVRATSNTASAVDSPGGATQRFYRVIVP